MEKRSPIENFIAWIGSVPSLITHTIVFMGAFTLGVLHVAEWEIILLVLTTVVSLEAIYLAIFIQMSVNRNTASLLEVESDIDDIHENVEDLSEDVDEIHENVEDIQEDLEDLSEDEERDQERKHHQKVTLEQLTGDIRRVLADIEALKKE